MTKEQLAERLNGRECGKEVALADRNLAKENSLVVVFGYSDDNMEFEGAINDEVGCYDGGTAYLNETGLWVNECEYEGCPYAEKEAAKCKTIEAVWHDEGSPCWTYETDIPHATFNIYEDDELWCVGMVFEMAALAAREINHD